MMVKTHDVGVRSPPYPLPVQMRKKEHGADCIISRAGGGAAVECPSEAALH